MLAPVTRILLRYGAGALVAYGLLSQQLGNQLAADRDVLAITEIGIGLAIGFTVEAYYWAAKRWGWRT